jgi:hypothetical protein
MAKRGRAGTDGRGGRDAKELRAAATMLCGRAGAAATTWGGGVERVAMCGGVGNGMRKA